MQKEISRDIMEVIHQKICIRREEKLKELNLKLDSLNRAAYYLLKGQK